MKVKELIEMLQKLPPDTELVSAFWDKEAALNLVSEEQEAWLEANWERLAQWLDQDGWPFSPGWNAPLAVKEFQREHGDD